MAPVTFEYFCKYTTIIWAGCWYSMCMFEICHTAPSQFKRTSYRSVRFSSVWFSYTFFWSFTRCMCIIFLTLPFSEIDAKVSRLTFTHYFEWSFPVHFAIHVPIRAVQPIGTHPLTRCQCLCLTLFSPFHLDSYQFSMALERFLHWLKPRNLLP